MGEVIELGLGALVAYWVAGAIGISFIWAAIAIAALYFFNTRGRGLGGHGAGVFTGINDMFHGIGNFAVSAAVFTAVMMIGTYFITVSNNYAFHQFLDLGWRPWLWPQGVPRDLLLWVCLAFVAAGIASSVSRGNTRVASWIFVVSGIFIFMMERMPATARDVGPSSAVTEVKGKGKDSTIKTTAFDATADEEGLVRPAIRGTSRLVLGKVPSEGIVPAVVNWGGKVFFGKVKIWDSTKSKPESPTNNETTIPAPQRQGEAVEALVLAGECNTPCSVSISYRFKIRGEGNPLRITFQGVDQPVDYPGEGDFQAPAQMRSGETKFVSLNALRPNVRVQVYKRETVWR